MHSQIVKRAVKLTNSQLRRHNALLRKNLKTLISCSTDNEKSFIRIDQMDTSLFAAPTIRSLFDTLLTEGARVFEMNNVTVTLETSLRDYYPNEYHDNEKSHFINSDRVSFLPVDDMENYFGDEMEPLLAGNVRRGTTLFFPNGFSERVRSEALVPLHNGQRLIGVVAFGSSDRARFAEGYSGRYLTRLARTITLKVELLRSQGPSFSGEVNAA